MLIKRNRNPKSARQKGGISRAVIRARLAAAAVALAFRSDPITYETLSITYTIGSVIMALSHSCCQPTESNFPHQTREAQLLIRQIRKHTGFIGQGSHMCSLELGSVNRAYLVISEEERLFSAAGSNSVGLRQRAHPGRRVQQVIYKVAILCGVSFRVFLLGFGG